MTVVGCTVNNGYRECVVQRKLNTGDIQNKILDPNSDMIPVVAAWGSSLTLNFHGNRFASTTLNLKSRNRGNGGNGGGITSSANGFFDLGQLKMSLEVRPSTEKFYMKIIGLIESLYYLSFFVSDSVSPIYCRTARRLFCGWFW